MVVLLNTNDLHILFDLNKQKNSYPKNNNAWDGWYKIFADLLISSHLSNINHVHFSRLASIYLILYLNYQYLIWFSIRQSVEDIWSAKKNYFDFLILFYYRSVRMFIGHLYILTFLKKSKSNVLTVQNITMSTFILIKNK